MALFFISACSVVICVVVIVLLKMAKFPAVHQTSADTQKWAVRSKSCTIMDVLIMLRKNKPFPVAPSKGWTLASFQHGHRVWSLLVGEQSTGEQSYVQVLAAYSKVHASSQVVLQLLKDASRVSEWCPGVVSSSQTQPPVEDPRGNTGSNPCPPVLSDEVVQMIQTEDNQRIKLTEQTFKRMWHRESNGCCWLLKMDEASQRWTFFLAQPAEDMDHSLLTVMMSDCPAGGATIAQTAMLLGCLEEQMTYRKAQFTSLLTISLPSSISQQTEFSNTANLTHTQDLLAENNNFFKEEVKFISKPNDSAKDPNVSPTFGKSENNKPQEMVASYSVVRYRPNLSMAKASSETELLKNQGGTRLPSVSEDSSDSSGEDHPPPLSETELTNKRTQDIMGSYAKPIRRVESDSNLFRKDRFKGDQNFNSVPRNEEERQKRRFIILANQAAAEVLAQVFKASAVELSKHQNDKLDTSEGWIFCGLDNDVVVLKRRFKNGMSTQSYMGKGLVRATPKAVWDAVRNPRMKFTYDESLKKVDILHSVSESAKIVYFYHEVLQIFRKDCCDFCVLQSERLEGKKYILSIQSIDWDSSPVTQGVNRGKLLPSGWIVEPVMKDNKVFSMVTFLMQMDMGGGKGGNTLPFEDLASRQPMSIVHLREYFKPLAVVVERSQGTLTC